MTQSPQDAPKTHADDAAKRMPCFTPGTKIVTERGAIAVEKLAIGDRVETRDNGVQDVVRTGSLTLGRQDLADDRNLRPVLVTKGALGDNVPSRDMLVSSKQKLLLQSQRAALLFWQSEVLAPARMLAETQGSKVSGVPRVTYIYLMFEAPQLILADGVWCETAWSNGPYKAARMVLKPWELSVLL